MLTKTLRDLESAGLIARCVKQSKPLAVEYSLTKLGRTFLVPLSGLCRWARRHNTDLDAIVRLAPCYSLERAGCLAVERWFGT
jgi:DNA-binding HxlR family transcriptional regulator